MRSKKNTIKRKHLTKASFRKRAKEDPEGFRNVYGSWTSLEATINILRGVVPHFPFKEDGSDVLGDIPFGPLDAMEFVCGFAAECGYNFSQPLCDTFAAYMKQGSKKTVKELSDVVENAFNDEKIEQRETFCDDGEHCRHFDIHDAFKEDEQLCKDFGTLTTASRSATCASTGIIRTMANHATARWGNALTGGNILTAKTS